MVLPWVNRSSTCGLVEQQPYSTWQFGDSQFLAEEIV